MGKNRKWQFISILAVAFLTVYNILPTVFFYTKPLNSHIETPAAKKIIGQIEQRVDQMEKDSLDWVSSYCSMLGTPAKKISSNPGQIILEFSKDFDASKFRTHIPRASSLIPFAPARLKSSIDNDPKTVTLYRQIPFETKKQNLFSWVKKNTPAYNQIMLERAGQIAWTLIENKAKAPSLDALKAMLVQESHFLFDGKSAVFSDLWVDFSSEKIILLLRKNAPNTALVDNIAKLARELGEKAIVNENNIEIPFHQLSGSSGVIALHLDTLADLEVEKAISFLKNRWNPQHPDLQNLPIVEANAYEALPIEEKSLCLIFSKNQQENSLQLFVKGLEKVHKTYEEFPDSPLAKALVEDMEALHMSLFELGFFRSQEKTVLYGADFQFEKPEFAQTLIQATRENFQLLGNKRVAILELSNHEQRILAENKIDTLTHEELIKWRDDYQAAQVHLDTQRSFDIPKPTKNILWNNLVLSLKKMVRGDDQKIIRWGLDLSGGKSVEIELLDSTGTVVSSDIEIKQGMDELYSRINKMGLSEVSIRQVGQHIVLDFPGSQALSATDLIKASSMYFHVVNEKFSPHSPTLGQSANQFLQGVWDEANFLGKTDAQSINEIAQEHLNKSTNDAKTLKENGLELFGASTSSDAIDEQTSKIVMQRGISAKDWQGLGHPLLFVFKEHALEGSQLENIYSSYDPQRGNFLSFGVISNDGHMSPRKHLHAWTSRYSKDNVLGTPNETASHGQGWRMAVVLNDSVISSPTLNEAIRDSASISGSFSTAEVQKLTADLKAGSLSFTPRILSEKNVSPELGKADREKGIMATAFALLLVVGAMIAYYRFAGLVASLAVIFNLLILWATLQNLGAALTLAGLAGIILTVGMSIDANVLVFERIKEEQKLGKTAKEAISAGYKKAFSAIVDSNVTTIIAALILLNFDAGPVKSFATNLIIGIISSMFTSLFVTRVYFTFWAGKPKNTLLKMANWIRGAKFNFLKHTGLSFVLALSIIGVGSSLLISKSSSILGLDFTGGYALQLEVAPSERGDYGQQVQRALLAGGAHAQDLLVQELSPSNQLRILFGQSMEQEGKPFAHLPLELEIGGSDLLYKKNPRISWVVDTLAASGISISQKTLSHLHADWTAVSGQMSNTMRNSALIGLLLSFVAIFIYLAFRFEYKFAAAAVVCVIHDTLITLAIMGILHFMGVPVQIDLITIAALMTVIGYSLNDTIIIFDRIREEMQQSQRTLKNTINEALNFTLSRTMITSGSTLLVLLALLFLGGASIFGFALVMTIGVVLGTLSSWFIAAPLVLRFSQKEEKALA